MATNLKSGISDIVETCFTLPNSRNTTILPASILECVLAALLVGFNVATIAYFFRNRMSSKTKPQLICMLYIMMAVSVTNIFAQFQKLFLPGWHANSSRFILSTTRAISNILFMEFGFEMLVLDSLLQHQRRKELGDKKGETVQQNFINYKKALLFLQACILAVFCIDIWLDIRMLNFTSKVTELIQQGGLYTQPANLVFPQPTDLPLTALLQFVLPFFYSVCYSAFSRTAIRHFRVVQGQDIDSSARHHYKYSWRATIVIVTSFLMGEVLFGVSLQMWRVIMIRQGRGCKAGFSELLGTAEMCTQVSMALQSLIIMVIIKAVYSKIEEDQLRRLAANKLAYHEHASFIDMYSLKELDRESAALQTIGVTILGYRVTQQLLDISQCQPYTRTLNITNDNITPLKVTDECIQGTLTSNCPSQSTDCDTMLDTESLAQEIQYNPKDL